MNTHVQSMTRLTAPQRAVQALARQLRAAIEHLRLARRRARMLEELQGLDDHLLRDIGLHRTELPSLVAEVIGAAPATRRQVMGRRA